MCKWSWGSVLWQMCYGNQEAKILCQWDMFMMYWLCILYVVLVAAFAFRIIGNWSSLPRDVGPCDLLEIVVRLLNRNGNFLSVVNCVLAWKPGKQECSLTSLFFRRKEDTWKPPASSPQYPGSMHWISPGLANSTLLHIHKFFLTGFSSIVSILCSPNSLTFITIFMVNL